ncbi:hypothetical protein JCM10213_000743 [Rhodosporidiobolus nylandii]
MAQRPARSAKTKALAARELQTSNRGDGRTPSDDEAWEEESAVPGEDAASESEEEYTPVAKKSKKGNAKKKQRIPDQGKLKHFVSMPMDVLSEICTYLDPLDLLHLSRSSRQFRSVFLRPSSASLWRKARRNVALPDLEFSMAEPAYASLMLEKYCMACRSQKPTLPKADYYLRKRFCSSFTPVDSFSGLGQVSTSVVRQCFLTTPRDPFSGTVNARAWTLKDGADEVLEALESLSKVSFVSMLQGQGRGSPALTAYVDARKKLSAERVKDGEALHAWEEQRACEAEERKTEENNQRSKERRLALEAKFLAEGWDAREFDNNEWIQHELVDCPTKLTSQNWKRCKPDLEAVLGELLEERLAEEAQDRYSARLNRLVELCEELRASQPDGDDGVARSIFPEPSTFLNWSALDALCDDDEEITDERWQAALPAINDQLADYRSSFISHLFSSACRAVMLANGLDRLFDSKLKKAAVDLVESFGGPYFFSAGQQQQREFLLQFSFLLPITCSGCHLSGTFPSFAGHHCHRDVHSFPSFILVLKATKDKVAMLLVLLEYAGVTSAAELAGAEAKLDALGKAFFCVPCGEAEGHGQQKRYDWKLMVDHFLGIHPYRPPSKVAGLVVSRAQESGADIDLTLSDSGDTGAEEGEPAAKKVKEEQED